MAQVLTTDGLLINTAIEFQKGITPLTFRQHMLFAWLKKTGRVKLRSAGALDMRRNVGVDVVTAQPYVRGAGWNFQTAELERQQQFTWRGVKATTALAMSDVMVNTGSTQIVPMYRERMMSCLKGLLEELHASLYIDGSLAANQARLEGLETFLTRDMTVAVTDADLVAIPSTTYAGLSTEPGAETDDWSTTEAPTPPNAAFGYDWPYGSGPFLFDYYSPKLVNTNVVIGADQGWGETGDKLLRRGIGMLNRLGGVEQAAPKVGSFGQTIFDQLKDLLVQRTRELMPHIPTRDMGFPGAVEFEGAVLDTDFNCPDQTGYLLNPNAVEMYYLPPPPQFSNMNSSEAGSMFFGIGPERIMEDYYYAAYFFGGMKWQPKYTLKFYPYSDGT